MDFINVSDKAKNDFSYIAENSLLSIAIIQQGFIKYFNQRFLDRLGYTKEEVLSWKKREFFKRIHPEDLSQLLEKMQIEDNKTIKFHTKVITKNGTILPIEIYICIITYEEKKAYMVCCNPLDLNINKNDIINIIKSDLFYDNFKNLDNKTLDLALILCKNVLNAFAKGDIHYIEKLVMNVHEIIFEIKEKRLFNNP